MNDLIIDGRVWQIEQDEHDELTVYGEDAVDAMIEIINSGREVTVQKPPHYCAVCRFLKVLSYGLEFGQKYICIETLTIRQLP